MHQRNLLAGYVSVELKPQIRQTETEIDAVTCNTAWQFWSQLPTSKTSFAVTSLAPRHTLRDENWGDVGASHQCNLDIGMWTLDDMLKSDEWVQ